ncbi:MAG TPA: dimethylsulfonioproprionate lyase family protein [Streptosporangiaceae bacterium]|jgi:hypothetical protein
MTDPLHHLVNALAARLDAAALTAHATDLRAAAHAPGGPGPEPVSARAALPVLGHLPEAMRIAGGGAAADLAAALDPLLPLVRWGQSPAYVADPPNAAFLAGYGHATLLGSPTAHPVAVDPSARVAFGLLLLGPGVHYPAHRHPADEVYLPLTPARWSTGTGADAVRPPGTPLHHPPGHPHAMRTGATPLLALYIWRGDTATPARLDPPDEPGYR